MKISLIDIDLFNENAMDIKNIKNISNFNHNEDSKQVLNRITSERMIMVYSYYLTSLRFLKCASFKKLFHLCGCLLYLTAFNIILPFSFSIGISCQSAVTQI
jgi:hypothetical protein